MSSKRIFSRQVFRLKLDLELLSSHLVLLDLIYVKVPGAQPTNGGQLLIFSPFCYFLYVSTRTYSLVTRPRLELVTRGGAAG